MNFKSTEKGQALVLIALAAVVLFGFAALAIDGSRLYSEKRHAQNAADTAVLAAALAYTRDNNLDNAGIANIAQTRATSNGYDNNGTSNQVTITTTDVPTGQCPGNVAGKDIKVDIVAYLDTTFARVLGRDEVVTAVTATSRACGYYLAPMFNGNAIVGLSPNNGNCAIDTGDSNSKSWTTLGGGVFSNGCLQHPNGTLNIPADKCVTSVGGANVSGGGSHACVQTNQGEALAYDYPDDVEEKMPPDPCVGAVTAGRYQTGGKIPNPGQLTFNDDIFCIPDLSVLDDQHVVLSNATLYVTDPSLSLRFNGGGDSGFFGTATTDGTYQGYYMIIKLLTKPQADACSQYFDFRGNGNLGMTGTILAPSTCVDYRGNSTGTSVHSQMVFYRFTGNGNSGIRVEYQAGENHQDPVYPTISVLK